MSPRYIKNLKTAALCYLESFYILGDSLVTSADKRGLKKRLTPQPDAQVPQAGASYTRFERYQQVLQPYAYTFD